MLPRSLLLSLLLLPVALVGHAQTCNDAIIADAPDSRYRDNGDGSVTDLFTGLIWKQCALGLSGAGCATGSASVVTWKQALQHAADNPPWRLPNKKQLASLVEARCVDPSINSRFFPNTPSDWFWSSSASAWGLGWTHSWLVDFDNGFVHAASPYGQGYVRLVRGGQ